MAMLTCDKVNLISVPMIDSTRSTWDVLWSERSNHGKSGDPGNITKAIER